MSRHIGLRCLDTSHWSGRRDSNPRPSPWQGDALPTEPRPRKASHSSSSPLRTLPADHRSLDCATGRPRRRPVRVQAGSSACHHGTGRSRRLAARTSSASESFDPLGDDLDVGDEVPTRLDADVHRVQVREHRDVDADSLDDRSERIHRHQRARRPGTAASPGRAHSRPSG